DGATCTGGGDGDVACASNCCGVLVMNTVVVSTTCSTEWGARNAMTASLEWVGRMLLHGGGAEPARLRSARARGRRGRGLRILVQELERTQSYVRTLTFCLRIVEFLERLRRGSLPVRRSASAEPGGAVLGY